MHLHSEASSLVSSQGWRSALRQTPGKGAFVASSWLPHEDSLYQPYGVWLEQVSQRLASFSLLQRACHGMTWHVSNTRCAPEVPVVLIMQNTTWLTIKAGTAAHWEPPAKAWPSQLLISRALGSAGLVFEEVGECCQCWVLSVAKIAWPGLKKDLGFPAVGAVGFWLVLPNFRAAQAKGILARLSSSVMRWLRKWEVWLMKFVFGSDQPWFMIYSMLNRGRNKQSSIKHDHSPFDMHSPSLWLLLEICSAFIYFLHL